MKDKKILLFYIISILMLANGTLFNWIFNSVGLVVWRQIIFVIGLYVVVKNKKNFRGFTHVLQPYGLLFVFVLFLSFITIVFNGYNPIRVVYANWIYFAGLPFLLCVPYMYRSGWNQSKINYFFVILGVIQTVGLFTDYYMGGAITTFFLGAAKGDGRTIEDILRSGRYCFLSEAPTTFSIYYCLSTTLCFHQILREKKIIKMIILYFVGASFIIGAWITGSRQLVAVLVLVFFLDTAIVLVKKGRFRIAVIPIAVTLFLLITPVVSFLYSDDAFSDRYSTESLQEDTRSKSWQKGWEECVLNPTLRRITIGDGVAYTTGNFKSKMEILGFHYENTFFSRISEIGLILGLFSLLLPIESVLKKAKYVNDLGLLCIPFSFSYLFICYVSPNGAATTTQMSLFILWGMLLYQYYNNSFYRVSTKK